MFEGQGVHHFGIGVSDLEKMISFYKEILEFTKVFSVLPEKINNMQDMYRHQPTRMKGGILFAQEAGGVINEMIQMITPPPRPIRRETRYNDIGINKMTIAVSDVEKFYKEYKGKMDFSSKPKSTEVFGWGDYHFVYGRDPEGNLIEFVSGKKIQVANTFGGVLWVGASVTDLERSVSFYQRYLGFDTVVVKPHESFSGLVDEITTEKNTQVRSCLLGNSKGGGMIELCEFLKPRGRSIPFCVNWADFGYIEIALETSNTAEVGRYYEQDGLEFLAKPSFVPLERPGVKMDAWYLYIRDPDGIPVEVISFEPKR